MKILGINPKTTALPVKVLFSIEPLLEEIKSYIKDNDHPFHETAQEVIQRITKYPELLTGIEDFQQLDAYKEVLDLVFKPLFPPVLQNNEIKAVSLPFNYRAFYPTKRLQNILENAGEGFQLNLHDLLKDKTYIYACSYILAKCYNRPLVKLSRPIYLAIPNQHTGSTRYYRLLFNADLVEVTKTDKAPELSEKDIDALLANGDDLDLWMQKFPPQSYIMKGFGIMNLFDTTNDVLISRTKTIFLRKDENVFPDFKNNLKALFENKDLEIGISAYNIRTHRSIPSLISKKTDSLFMKSNEEIDYHDMFCKGISQTVFQQRQMLAISDVEHYGQQSGWNNFYQRLKANDIKSLLLVPISESNQEVQILEIASDKKNELNILVGDKLDAIIPFMKIASERYSEESANIIESTIQENYTSIHPSVKWRFIEAASKFNQQKMQKMEDPILEDIVFEDVYPLYGQSDIVGSSVARNKTIQADLDIQLRSVIETFKKIIIVQDFPIYKELIFRVQECLKNVRKGLKAGDEMGILDFLTQKIYPVFNHVKTLDPAIKTAVEQYEAKIDPDLKVVYQQRKNYENSVNTLNEKLANFLDRKQEEAQKMFPHYFERYKTDGVEYNMYIGNSLVNDHQFNNVYLQNLRLWQLQIMWQVEQIAYDLSKKMPYPLRVASLILVHSNPLAIKFRMDEKQFDVDGAYNARYEIVKKRIDKSYIKGTTERLTQAGKLAIVYSQDSDVEEYTNYLRFMQSENKIGKIEFLELEDLQGVSGLKAIRVDVIYKTKEKKNGQTVQASKDVSKETKVKTAVA